MPNRPLNPELAIQLIQALGVVIRVGEEYIPELKTLCSMWLRRTDTEHTLDRLVEVLLCTPGAGHLVTGLVPICEYTLMLAAKSSNMFVDICTHTHTHARTRTHTQVALIHLLCQTF